MYWWVFSKCCTFKVVMNVNDILKILTTMVGDCNSNGLFPIFIIERNTKFQ